MITRYRRRPGYYGALAATGAAAYYAGRRAVSWYRRPRKTSLTPYQLERQIKNLRTGRSGKEWKTHDVAYNSTVGNAGTIRALTLIAQGDTSLDREGLQIRLQSINIRGFAIGNLNAGASIVRLRLILFQDMEQHGTIAAVTDVLETADVLAFKEHDSKPRFKILWDRLYDLTAQGDSTNPVYKIRYVKYYKRLKGRKAWFSTSAATQAAQGKGNIYMLLIGDQATDYPTIDVNCRIRFTG